MLSYRIGQSRIINNSVTSTEQHERIGFSKKKRVIIPNGFNTDQFTPSEEERKKGRHELQVSQEALLVGLIGRYHPMKDHENFLESARILLDQVTYHDDVHFVLVGRDVNKSNNELMHSIQKLHLKEIYT